MSKEEEEPKTEGKKENNEDEKAIPLDPNDYLMWAWDQNTHKA